MRLPSNSASYTQRVRFGRYVTTRLRQAKRGDLADGAEAVTNKVKASGRKVEDATEPVLSAMALRDASDSEMDVETQNFSLELASRSLHAPQEPPYTQIFHKGIGYYIAAPFSENVARYRELVRRVETHLPKGDELRSKIVTAIVSGLESYKNAVADLQNARAALAVARTECEAAEDEWNTLMEKTYGVLIVDYSKKNANRFFPRARRVELDAEIDEASPPT